MSKAKKVILFMSLLLLASCLAGCSIDVNQLVQKTKPQEEQLMKVELFFTDQEQLVAYVKNMGIAEDGKVYAGGTSMNYLYDEKGNIIGSYNYQHLIYMKILPLETDQK